MDSLRSKWPVSSTSGVSVPDSYARPDLLAVVGGEQLGREAPEEAPQVVDVAHQHARRVVVAGRVDRLGQVDDHRAVGAEQDVELAQVAVDHAGAEHAHDLADQAVVVRQARTRA